MTQNASTKTPGSGRNISRRRVLKGTAATATVGLSAPFLGPVRALAADPIEIVHWSWLAASDG